jgi:hypothetical protein
LVAGSAGERVIASGGSIANVILGLAALACLRGRPPRSATARLFLWFLVAVNLLMAFGYLLFSGIGDIGDWSVVTQGVGPEWLRRAALTAIGAVLYFWWLPRLLAPDLAPFIAGAESRRRGLAVLLRRPYLWAARSSWPRDFSIRMEWRSC